MKFIKPERIDTHKLLQCFLFLFPVSFALSRNPVSKDQALRGFSNERETIVCHSFAIQPRKLRRENTELKINTNHSETKGKRAT